MDLRNAQCLNLGGCVGSSASAVKIVKERESPALLDSGRPLVPSVEFASFPAPISRLVGEYLPIAERSYVETAFAGVQPITLCLSQNVGSKLASCWSIGVLPPEQQWEPSEVKIDKQFPINDHKRCLDFLNQGNSNYCRMAIKVLVVKLSKTLNDLPSTLYDVRITIKELKDHLSSVKHVVFSIKEYASCCFTLNNAIGNANEMPQSVDHSKAIFEILDDLYVCWRNDCKLTVHRLFDFYFKSKVERASEKYLAKFVIPLNTNHTRDLFKKEASKMLSTKIMWVCSLVSEDDFTDFHQDTTRLCHAFHLDMSGIYSLELLQLRDRVLDALYFQDNPFIERIVIDSGSHDRAMQLPRPMEPLTDDTPRSALIELSLNGNNRSFDLKQLSNGYFPHLAHLTVIGGFILGHLDSDRLPCLKTLRLELGDISGFPRSTNYPLVQERAQSLIHAGRPWQLVGARSQGGWWLASYDEPITNPQDDGKDDAALSLPVIRELLLVMENQSHADEWQSQLEGHPSVEAAAKDHRDRILVWAPQCVQKITAFGMNQRSVHLEFKESIPEQTRILASLECRNVTVELHGDVLPNLQSLEMNCGHATLSGAFPQLKTLSFKESSLRSRCELNAPLLQSLSCQSLIDARGLSLRPELLPHLSYLRIKVDNQMFDFCPRILVDENSHGLSRVKHVVLGKGMTMVPGFHQWQVQNVSHLELAVDAWELPARWLDTEWLCETLILNIYKYKFAPKRLFERDIIFIKIPLLPKVKTLTVTSKEFPVLLDSEMPHLLDLTVASPGMLGPNLRCPALRCIRYTGKLTEGDKEKCLNRATYETMGAQPSLVYFGENGDAKRVSYKDAPSAIVESSDEE